MKRPFVTLILAGGKGTRMGSSDKHKVCFEVLGVPAIVRALETYNLCGSILNVVVVGALADNVMATVSRRFPGTAFAFQEKPLGTGHAARCAAEILERMRFEGDVLVVAGDKIVQPAALHRLLDTHQRNRADVTLATTRRPPNSSAGILLKTARGNIAGILEEAERQRLVALARFDELLHRKPALSGTDVQNLCEQHCSPKAATALMRELWGGDAPVDSLTRSGFELRVPANQRDGMVRVGASLVPVDQILAHFDQVNLSTYLFRAPVLYDALHRLQPARGSQEEYLTDTIEILARRQPLARVVGCEIEDAHDLMAFNNPQELLAIEDAFRQRQGVLANETSLESASPLATAKAWLNLLQKPTPAARRQFRRFYGEDIPWQNIHNAVAAFARCHGEDRSVAIVRSPGRINLLGRHIDHQGGTVNVMAINREILVVASPRADDQVTLSNLQESQFGEQAFRISDLVAKLDWDDWQRVIDGPRIQRLLDAARGDWANYIKASIMRLQEQFRDRKLRGLDLLVGGEIPMGAGLSSSSALVVAAAEVVSAFNRLPVSARQLVSLCGESEWFVGTRGGAADHAAIKLSRLGYVTRVGFFPFEIGESAAFFPDHDLLVCNSGIYAGKSHEARNTFNEKVTSYHIGRTWLKMLRPDLASKIQHLRDVTPERLGLTRSAFAKLLLQLPARLARSKIQAAFAQMPTADRKQLERLFQSHDAPATGYAVRDVVLFGITEMARAGRCLALLKQNDAAGLGRLMRISHNGDRVSVETARGGTRRKATCSSARELSAWAESRDRGRTLADLSGAYGCSLPELDRIVDVALGLPGVEGAQLAGAGLGGCVMVLVGKPHTDAVRESLAQQQIQAEVFRPIAGACSLVMA